MTYAGLGGAPRLESPRQPRTDTGLPLQERPGKWSLLRVWSARCRLRSRLAGARSVTLGEVVHTATRSGRMFHVEPRDVTALAHGDRQSDASLFDPGRARP